MYFKNIDMIETSQKIDRGQIIPLKRKEHFDFFLTVKTISQQRLLVNKKFFQIKGLQFKVLNILSLKYPELY